MKLLYVLLPLYDYNAINDCLEKDNSRVMPVFTKKLMSGYLAFLNLGHLPIECAYHFWFKNFYLFAIG